MEEQTLILVDDNDKILGYEKREKCHAGKGLHHRAFVVLLENKKGEVLLQKRRHLLWDKFWDITATTHPLHLETHDESYLEAGKRVLEREMGIKNVSLSNIGSFNYFAKHGAYCENEYCAILTGVYQGNVLPNKDAVYEYQWMPKEEFIDKCLKNDKSFTPWTLLTGTFFKKPTTPRHVALIMDGNRRWAKKRLLPTIVGHRKGYSRIEELVPHAKKLGIKHITFWAFSTENWNREKKEVDDLLSIFRTILKKSSLEKILKEGAKIVIFGDITRFPKDIQKNVAEVLEDSKNNTQITVNIALNYGGHAEILKAVNELVKKGKTVSEEEFSNHLYSQGQPDPDLLIRTGGEKRLSGYLPWQTVYSELYFIDTLWPDFDAKALDSAVLDYEKRSRRFGR